MGDLTMGMRIWWAWLCAVSVVNLLLLARSWARHTKNAAHFDAEALRRQHRLLVFATVFVLGCAFRSFLPRADVQRIVLVDTWLSSVLVGRTVATAAELAFVAQWAIILETFARAAGFRRTVAFSKIILPSIVVAEVFSWCGVLTMNNLWHFFEESIWGCCEVVLTLSALILWGKYRGRARRFMAWMAICGAIYVTFMFTIDIPTYFSRWRADTAAGKAYASLAEGFANIAFRWTLTHDARDWQGELVWMVIYFTLAVWVSLALAGAPLGNLEEEAVDGARRPR